MENIFFMNRVIKSISEGGLFRQIYSITLKCLAVLLVIGALIGWIAAWRMTSHAPAALILGVVIFQVISIITTYCVFHTIWIRANDIMALTDTEFVVTPIMTIFVKLIGEVLACQFIGLGIGAGILLWFAGNDDYYFVREFMPFPITQYIPSGGSGFLGGLLLMAACAICAFLVLVIAYFISEQFRVFVEIAMNTKSLKTSSTQVPMSASIPFTSPVLQPVKAPVDDVICPECDTKNESSAYYCAKCGYKLGGQQ